MSGVEDRWTPEGRRFMAELRKLASKQVNIGFQSGDTVDGVEIVDIAAFNELGTEDIPSRPFIRGSVDNNKEKIGQFMVQEASEIQQGKSAAQVLKAVGVFQKGVVQEEITNGNFVPNLPATIKRKGSDKPLIDTGRMRQSVQYTITDKEGE